MSLLGVNEVRKFGRISQEEDRGVVSDEVPVAFVGSELDGKASGVSSTVMRARLTTHGGESDGHRASLALGAPNVERGQVIDRVSAFEETMGSRALCVDYTFGDSLSVKMSQQVNEMEVLQEEGAVVATSLRFVGMRHGGAIATQELI